ncbi:MAG: 4-hydroxythreonine-4-phosphate dehydrogenase PdxA [Candidatus Aminicenantaceae bacterium]
MTIPKIGITLGDPGGIGPEVILKALSLKNSIPKAHYILFGNSLLIKEEKKNLGIELNIQPITRFKQSINYEFSLHEVHSTLRAVKKGFPSKENGEASFLFFKEGTEAAKQKKIQSLVTAPISKKSWELAGLQWRGHTDYLRQKYPQAIMAFWSEKIKVALFTSHLPLKEALEKIREKDLLEFFLIIHRCIERIRSGKYELLVAGLNPHAGEEGLLGTEEKKEIIPAIKKAQNEGLNISGPYPPDIVYRKAINQPDKIVIALYHDQGLIPFKLLTFEKGVNLTLGLPFIRTSPDHGTAFDIVGQGKANPQSIIEAIKLAHSLSQASL